MNKDVFEGKWKQVRGEVRGWWGKLTDDDLEQSRRSIRRLCRTAAGKYGYSRAQAEGEIEKNMNEYETKLKNSMPNS